MDTLKAARERLGTLYGILALDLEGNKHQIVRRFGSDQVAWWHRPEEAEESRRTLFGSARGTFVVVLSEALMQSLPEVF